MVKPMVSALKIIHRQADIKKTNSDLLCLPAPMKMAIIVVKDKKGN